MEPPKRVGARNSVKRHRRSIDVGDSEHLGGARVTIELPLPDTEPADPTATIT